MEHYHSIILSYSLFIIFLASYYYHLVDSEKKINKELELYQNKK